MTATETHAVGIRQGRRIWSEIAGREEVDAIIESRIQEHKTVASWLRAVRGVFGAPGPNGTPASTVWNTPYLVVTGTSQGVVDKWREHELRLERERDADPEACA